MKKAGLLLPFLILSPSAAAPQTAPGPEGPLPRMAHLDIARSAAWSPGGDRIVSASFDRTVRVWDAATGRFEPVTGLSR
jgi:WD40 repeat protein